MEYETKVDVVASAFQDRPEYENTLSPSDCRSLARIAVDAIDKARRELCKHTNRQGTGSAGSDGSSSFTGYCGDCGKDLSYKIVGGGALSDPTLQLQPRN